jgi:hypothetical protein
MLFYKECYTLLAQLSTHFESLNGSHRVNLTSLDLPTKSFTGLSSLPLSPILLGYVLRMNTGMNERLKWGYMEMYVKAFLTLDNALH